MGQRPRASINKAENSSLLSKDGKAFISWHRLHSLLHECSSKHNSSEPVVRSKRLFVCSVCGAIKILKRESYRKDTAILRCRLKYISEPLLAFTGIDPAPTAVAIDER